MSFIKFVFRRTKAIRETLGFVVAVIVASIRDHFLG